ncbi:MAG: isoprenyl transferase [Defluviitaleaceae bacterium]|nr:isoprenyl transferase [Defluviitaleaceae bacterium]
MLFKKKSELEVLEEIVSSTVVDKETVLGKPLPRHVAIILDGNGRWAQQQGKPRVFGHQAGMFNVEHIAEVASGMNIEAMTLYAFSTENWKRAAEEVAFLMKLPIRFFDRFAPTLMRLNIKTKVLGNKEELPEGLQTAIRRIEQMTANNTGMKLMIALNYGAQDEIMGMVKKIANKVKEAELSLDDIDSKLIDDHLLTKGLPPVDLLIRTSGEQRISNFLLWQIAYAELYFTEIPWPAFKEGALLEAISQFQQRDRRFGGVKK